jgi:hypothetical protein
MRSSERLAVAILAGVWALAWPSRAAAQSAPPPTAQGFALERLYPSAPGAGWFVMDALDMHGGLGGAMQLTTGYAHDPLRAGSSDGTRHLEVVSDAAFADFGLAATYDRLRAYVDFTVPVVMEGDGGALGAYAFKPPAAAPDATPDLLSDVRFGLDVRIVGDSRGPFRLGAGAQLFVPSANENRSEYVTDGQPRAMFRALFAGDAGAFTYAGHVGVHVRPIDDTPAPASARGSELLFGAAAGARLPLSLGAPGGTALVVGPEVFGASAFSSFFDTEATALEALLSARVEGTGDDGAQIRLKLGGGGGLNDHFGAPEWRVVFGIELFDHHDPHEKPAPPPAAR